MKQSTRLYNCQVWDSKIQLHVEHRLVANYPMTMSPRECVEEWCESVGWKLLDCFGVEKVLGGIDYYEFQFERPHTMNVYDTIIKCCYAYEWGE